MAKKVSQGKILKVSGPLVVASGMRDAEMFDVVEVSDKKLIGEVIEIHGDLASIQVYEETAGLGPGEPVVSTSYPLACDLAPGLMGNMFDGIQRPLDVMYKRFGNNIKRGVKVDKLDREKLWAFEPVAKAGQKVQAGDVLGTVQETSLIKHYIMVPPTLKGELEVVSVVPAGEHTIVDDIATLKDSEGNEHKVQMLQRWPVRRPRPYAEKLAPSEPLITGQRVIDAFFPITKGGTAAIPGPFGSGKTVTQHQLAKWAASDVVVYIGCGERGNEMTDVLNEFPELIDPKTGKSLMERTILIANTSDMPVAAREASIYTGMTIAEYYRDMGYSVSIMADSTSRWAEALREMSGRLEEMPGEEGYPAYLGSRLAQFYERAGMVTCLGSEGKEGVLTAIGAVSPPGGDMSDPVVQATLRIVKVFWRLDSALAYRRHFPAINWLQSYSLYDSKVLGWMDENVDAKWSANRRLAMQLLQDEAKLEEIVKLVGSDSLPLSDQYKMQICRMIREDFLHQNSFDEIDTYTSLQKQFYMLDLIITLYHEGLEALKRGVDLHSLQSLPELEPIGRFKLVPEAEIKANYERLQNELKQSISSLSSKY